MSLTDQTERQLSFQRDTNNILTAALNRLVGMVPDPGTDSMPADSTISSALAQLDWEVGRGKQLAMAILEYVDGPQAESMPATTSGRTSAEFASRPH
jgi:hypothetical protein